MAGKPPVKLQPRILVIGDSHSTFWTGHNTVSAKRSIFKGVDVEHIGPLMAYGLPSKRSPVPGVIEKMIAAKPDAYKLIVMCFGEVDVRGHIISFAHLRGTSIDDVVEDVADCYLQFVDAMVAKFGIPVALWGPPPSRPAEARGYIPAFPVTGAPLERNYATMRLTRALAKRCNSRSRVEFFTLFDELIGIDHRTLPGVLYDSTHLSSRNLPAALVELRKVFSRLGLEGLEECLDREWEVSAKPRAVNVASPYWQAGVNAAGQFWARADLLSAFTIDEVRLALPLEIDGLGTLRSVACGEGAISETLYAAADGLAPSPAGSPAAGEALVIKPAKRVAYRFVTFTFDPPPKPAPPPPPRPEPKGLVPTIRKLLGRKNLPPPPSAPAGPSPALPQTVIVALQAKMPRAVRVMAPIYARSLK